MFARRSSYMQRGFSILLAIKIIIVILLVIWLGYCGIGYLANANKIAPMAVKVSGPATFPRGPTQTFTVTVDLATNTTALTMFDVEIWEDDSFGDTKLIKAVTVRVPASRGRGTATFTLNCDATGNLVGADGQADAETPFHLYGEIDSQAPVTDFVGANFETACAD